MKKRVVGSWCRRDGGCFSWGERCGKEFFGMTGEVVGKV